MWCFVRNGRRCRILGALCLLLCLLLTGCRAERANRAAPATAAAAVSVPTQELQPVPTYTPTPTPVALAAEREALAREAVEREAVAALFLATQGPNWAGGRQIHWRSEWRRVVPTAHWTGVTLNAQGQVKGLAVAGVGLRGQVPAALGQLTALESLDLAANLLYGPLPRELGQLSLLQTLQLGGNAWTGCLPAAWRDLRPRQTDIGELGLPYCDTEVRGRYDDPVTHRAGSYQLQRRETQITATLRTPRAPLPGAGAAGPVLFTLPPGFWPGTPYTRRVWGHGVRADGQPWGSHLEPRRGRLQVAADGTVRLVAEGAPVSGYWAYTVTAAWEVAPAGDPPIPVSSLPPRPADPEETTPLHAAAAAGQAEVVRQLLTAGAALEAGDDRDRTPLHHAAQAGKEATVEVLLAAGAALEARDELDRTPLHFAAQAGEAATVQVLLAAGADVAARDWRNETPLHFAAQAEQAEQAAAVVQLLLAAGADREARTRWDQETPLHHAAVGGHVEVVELLLTAGADIRSRDVNGVTPLHGAVAADSSELVELLLTAGSHNGEGAAGLLAAWSHGGYGEPRGTPLHWAAGRNRISIAQQLLAAGAQVQALSGGEEGTTPLYEAWGEEMAGLLLAAGAELDEPGILSNAAQFGNPGKVRVLLAAGADPNPDSEGWTPLHAAVVYQREENVELLLAAGADPEHALLFTWRYPSSLVTASPTITEQLLVAGANPNVFFQNLPFDTDSHPLTAAKLGDALMVDMLLAAGANPNTRDRGGTPLHWLCLTRGEPSGPGAGPQGLVVLERLLAAGANPRAVTAEGWTPLHYAVQFGRYSSKTAGWPAGVERLLAAGADPHQPDAEGVTPLQLAEQQGQWALAALLQAPVSPRALEMDYGWTALHQAAQRADRAGVAQLLTQGHDPNLRTYYAETALHQAVQGQDVALVELLLQAGADLQAQTRDGYTPLHLATRSGQAALVAFLLTQGHDPNLRTYYGETALHQAVQGQDVALVELLLQAGADLEAQTSYGYTALHLAAHTGSVPVVSALLAAGADRGRRTDGNPGRTPYQIAAHSAEGGGPEVADLLRIVEDEPPAKPD